MTKNFYFIFCISLSVKKYLSLMLIIIFCFYFKILQAQTFSNSTAAACNTWDSGNAFGTFTRTIAVSGLPTVYGAGSSEIMLKQINVKLGSAACKANLSTYSFQLTSPAGTNYLFINGLVTTISSVWGDFRFRDHSALERIRDYPTSVQQSYFPYSIGYYRVETAGSFATAFAGENPNGNWIFSIRENTASEVSFEKIDIIFGKVEVNDVSASTSNNGCSGATCLDTKSVVIGTNNGYGNGDPNYVGNTISGCSWNGANNNSAWFSFTATAATSYITMSGILNSSTPTSSDTQAIVLQAPATCTIPTVLATGGCPDDQTRNNTPYIDTNGGGSTSANVYVNGISANCEFNLSGLVVGQQYYLFVDGNGGVSSTFYIEMSSGGKNCNDILPLDWLSFEVACEKESNKLVWSVANSYNNKQFEVQAAKDAKNFETIAIIPAKNGVSTQFYTFWDNNNDAQNHYYRIKQVDYDNKVSYSKMTFCSQSKKINVSVYPNPFEDKIQLSGFYANNMTSELYDVLGKQVPIEIENDETINFSNVKSGIYFLKLFNQETQESQMIKLMKKE